MRADSFSSRAGAVCVAERIFVTAPALAFVAAVLLCAMRIGLGLTVGASRAVVDAGGG